MIANSDDFPWQGTICDAYAEEFADGALTFFTSVIEPASTRLSEEIADCGRGSDDASIRRWESLRSTQREMHCSFVLALGGIWERHFRNHLYQSVAVLGPTEKVTDAQATWDKVIVLFRECRGFDLECMPGYPTLKLLVEVSNVVRHGTGRTSKALQEAHPEWFNRNPVSSWLSYFTRGGEPPHSIHRLDISLEQLRGFAEAIAAFWETVARLRAR